MKYLLGPISMAADLIWAPNPKRFNFETPLINLMINMAELKLIINFKLSIKIWPEISIIFPITIFSSSKCSSSSLIYFIIPTLNPLVVNLSDVTSTGHSLMIKQTLIRTVQRLELSSIRIITQNCLESLNWLHSVQLYDDPRLALLKSANKSGVFVSPGICRPMGG